MPKLKGKNYFGFQAQIKSVETRTEGETKKITIKGFASTPQVDRYDDIVDPKAFSNAIELYMTNPVILLGHDPDIVIGLAIEGKITNKGLYVTAEITEDGSKETEVAMKRIEQGKLRTMSIGYRPLEVRFSHKETGEEITVEQMRELPWEAYEKYSRKITSLDLVEISVVSTPANPGALFDVSKSIKSFLDEREAVLSGKLHVEEEEKELYLITSHDMKTKNTEQKNTPAEGVELENPPVEVEEEEMEGVETQAKPEDAQEGNPEEAKAAETPGENPGDGGESAAENAEAQAPTDQGANADEGKPDEGNEGKEPEQEEAVEASYSGLKSVVQSLGQLCLDAKDTSEGTLVEVKIDKLVDLNNKKEVALLLKSMLEVNFALQKSVSEMEAKLASTPDKKALITSKHYKTDDEQAAEEKGTTGETAQRKAAQSFVKSLFSSAGIMVRD